MTNTVEGKRLSDEELEGVAGGVAPPTLDPLMMSGLTHGVGAVSMVETHIVYPGNAPHDPIPHHPAPGSPVFGSGHDTVAQHSQPAPEPAHAIGGVAPPSISPSAVASLTNANVGSLLGGGGAFANTTPTATHTDSTPPVSATETVTGNTHTTVSGASLFGGGPVAPPAQPFQLPADVPHGSVTLSGNLNLNLPPQPPPATMELQTFTSTDGTWTKITAIAEGDSPVDNAHSGPNSVLGRAF